MQMPREEEVPDMKAPVFDLLPEVVQVEEGETAKFMVKVSGNPRPRVTWWLNGTIVVNVSSAYSLCETIIQLCGLVTKSCCLYSLIRF